MFDPSDIRLPDYSNFNHCENVRRALTLSEIRSSVRKKVMEWSRLPDDPQFYVSIDGLSGSGKSVLTEMILSLNTELGELPVLQTEVDEFITTERNSKSRVTMTDSEGAFWKRVYDRKLMQKFLLETESLGFNGGALEISKSYNHETGDFRSKSVKVAKGKKIIFIDGIDSTNVLDEIGLVRNRLKIFVFTSAETSLLSACLRDATRGINILDRLKARIGEYKYLLQRLGETLRNPEVLVFDNSYGRPSIPNLAFAFQKLRQEQNNLGELQM
jgi:uridine kinase